MQPDHDRPHILVVDDDDALLRIHARALASKGYRVETAPDGAAAARAIEAASFDVILSDIDMPGMNGIQLLERVSIGTALSMTTSAPKAFYVTAAVSAALRRPTSFGEAVPGALPRRGRRDRGRVARWVARRGHGDRHRPRREAKRLDLELVHDCRDGHRASTHHGAVRVRRDLGRAHDGALKQTRPVVAGDGRKLRSRRARAAHRRRHPRPTQLAPATRRDTSWVPRKGPGYSCYLASPWSIEGNMKTLYTAVATVHGGREGHVKSDDGVLDLDLKIPKSMGGPGGAGSNPEQLFAAGYGACFESALRLVARREKKPLNDSRITAQVSLITGDTGEYGLGVELHGHLDGVSAEETRALMEAAHEVCPYSRATRGNIDVKLIAD
jgi:osmotically inducible protein OsmC